MLMLVKGKEDKSRVPRMASDHEVTAHEIFYGTLQNFLKNVIEPFSRRIASNSQVAREKHTIDEKLCQELEVTIS
jgi:hypothetical protein